MSFDTHTAFLIAGTLYLLIPITVRWVLLRHATRSANLWTLGGLFIGLGLMLVSQRDQLSPVMAYTVTIAALFFGLFSIFFSLLMELHIASSKRKFAACFLIFIVIYEILRFFYFDQGLQFIWAVAVAASSLIGVGSLVIANARREGLFMSFWVGVIYCFGGALLVLRLLAVMAGLDTPSLLSPQLFNSLMVLFGLFAGVMSNFAYLGIFLEKSSRLTTSMAAENARLEEVARLSEQIAHLDRQRGVGAIATSLCHELSQPLTNVSVICEYGAMQIAQQPLAPEEQKKIFSDIARNATLGREILERIRNFIRPSQNHHRPLSMQAIAEDVARLVQDSCRKEQVEIEIIPPVVQPLVSGDSIQLSQILLNLYRNAMQALKGQARKCIVVRFGQEDQKVCVFVQDSGPGLAPEMLGRVGTPFLSSKPDGLGMGFSISRTLAEQHGGSLSIRNAAEGGAIAELRLPALHRGPAA